MGFGRTLVLANIHVVEFWSVFVGLQLAYDRGFRCIDLNLDFDSIVKCVFGAFVGSSDDCSLVRRTRQILDLDWMVTIKHV